MDSFLTGVAGLGFVLLVALGWDYQVGLGQCILAYAACSWLLGKILGVS